MNASLLSGAIIARLICVACPSCRIPVPVAATTCGHCGRDIEARVERP